MEQVPAYRLIIAATMVFIVGLFIFTIIFRAFITFQELEQIVIEQGTYDDDQLTLIILGSVPWALGGFYVSLLAGIIYFLLRGNKPANETITRADFRKR
jgi:hypothetical protein